jgi:hypothetical protein
MVSLSLLLGGVVPNGPEASRARRYWARRKRTLDGEDRSEMIEEEGKAGEPLAKSGPPFWYPRPPPPTRRPTWAFHHWNR